MGSENTMPENCAICFDSLASCSHLVLTTSSCLGHPPHNLSGFAHQLLLAAETAPGCLGLLSTWTLLPAGPREWATSFVHGRKTLGVPGGLQFAGPSPRGQAQVQMHCPQGEMQINLQRIPPPGFETRSLG